MAIDLPSDVAFFLNMCGIPYPDINEDDVRALARHVRTFASQVQDTHSSATGVIDDMGSVYSGYSYEQLVASWASMSSTHMVQLADACKIVEQALYAAATVITVVKIAVLAELAALAAAYMSMLVTPPLTPSAPLVAAAARRLCDQMQQCLIGYIVAEVIGRAIEPLEDAIDDMIKGIVYDATRHALGVPEPSGSSSAVPLRIEPDEVRRYAKVLDEHADDIMQHAATFAENVSTLDFTTATRFDDTVNVAVPDRSTAPTISTGTPEADPSSRLRELSDSTPSVTAPTSSGSPVRAGADSAHSPVAAGVGDRPRSGAGSAGGRSESADNRATTPAGEGRSAPARMPSVTGPASTLPDSGRPGEVPAAVSQESAGERSAPRVGLVASHDAMPGEPAHPAADSEGRRPSWVSGVSVATATPAAADGTAAGHPVGGSPPPQPGGAEAKAATPWGRGGDRAPTPKALPPKAVRPVRTRPSVGSAPAVTPWTIPRRTRDVPAAVHAPSTAGPPVRSLREKGTEPGRDDKVESAGSSDRAVAPARVTAPTSTASEPVDPPGTRA
ncbi:hypothetical protein OHB12_31960 [Nocardia sp. NBC_01730]|uniref:WXG100-like domain-containing protein n=1 Tax=Nocardia sp. NBC_01730 TaxID=2975998 RepID=UPI002E115BAA|nr:hypothetical protein OHB12_31960 [Nocardia sp. NBC_01730]